MFRVYYGDGTVYEGDNPDLIQKLDDVQCVAWDDPTRGSGDIGRIVLHEWDMYIYSEDIGWHGADKYYDLIQHVQKGSIRALLTGRWMEYVAYCEIKKRAYADPGMRRKSATHPKFEDGRA